MTATVEKKDAARNRRSIKNYLINRRFQLRWISSILALSLLIFITLGAYMYLTGADQTEMVRQLQESCPTLTEGYDDQEMKGLNEDIHAHDQTIVWILAIAGAVMVLMLAGLAIMQTHRVAGPIFALCRFMESVTKGRFQVPRALRKGDHFQEAGHALQSLVQSLRDNEEAEIAILVQVESVDGMPSSAKAQISELVAQKRSRLE